MYGSQMGASGGPFSRDDLENDPVWLERLESLNNALAATGEPLEGNLFYGHQQPDFVSKPPSPLFKAKRDRLLRVVAGRKVLLEIGVNGGHSAFLVLSANRSLEFHGVDICAHRYVREGITWLKSEFPDRVHLHAGDSREVLESLATSGLAFDIFHIDGAKYRYFGDVLNCHRLLADGQCLALIDDAERPDVSRTLRRCRGRGLIEATPEFPPMPMSEPHRNEIVVMKPLAPSHYRTLLTYDSAVQFTERIRFKAKVTHRHLTKSKPSKAI
jgi:Methyltransferase domain